MAGNRGSRGGRERALFGLLLIVVGGVWLLGDLGLWFLSWAAFWPLILVALGVAIVVGVSNRSRGAGSSTVGVPRDGARRLEVRLNMYGGRLTLGAGATGLLDATSRSSDLRVEVRRHDSDALVRLAPAGVSLAGFAAGAEWNVAIPSDLPVTVRVSAGAGEFHLDLGAVMLLGASLSVGACHAELRLPPPTGDVPVTISAGASGIDLRLPPGVEAQVTGSGLTSSINGIRETPGYAAARDRLTVRVSGGAAQVNVLP